MMRHDDVGSKMLKAVFSIAFAVLLGSPAGAHITLEGKQAAVGSYYKAVFAVQHGCAGSATGRRHRCQADAKGRLESRNGQRQIC